MSPEYQRQANCWLNGFATKYSSQFGEDGIAEKILELLPDKDSWCVEFGAWDGKHLSNTYHFIVDKNFSGVLLEGDSRRFQALQQTYLGLQRVIPMNRLVGFSGEDRLDRALAATPIPTRFDLLSIDIDGNDYYTWEAIEDYRPKIVIIEYNPTIPDPVEFVQPKDPHVMQGSSLLSLCKLGKRKGYELVATTFCNALFVDSQYYPLFGIADNSISQMRADYHAVTYLFHGYDGTVFLSGASALHWHGIPFHPSCFQLLPSALRKYPDNYTQSETRLFHLYKELFCMLIQRGPFVGRQLPTVGELPQPLQLGPREMALWQGILQALRELGLPIPGQ